MGYIYTALNQQKERQTLWSCVRTCLSKTKKVSQRLKDCRVMKAKANAVEHVWAQKTLLCIRIRHPGCAHDPIATAAGTGEDSSPVPTVTLPALFLARRLQSEIRAVLSPMIDSSMQSVVIFASQLSGSAFVYYYKLLISGQGKQRDTTKYALIQR